MAQPAAKHAPWLSAFRRSGRYVCQDCDPTRRPEHRGEKNLRVTVDGDGVRAHCHHCSASFAHQFSFEDRRVEPGNSQVIERNFTSADRLAEFSDLDAETLAYLATRGISQQTAEFYRCVSGSRFYRRRKEIPEGRYPGIGFRYFDGEKHYATKWRRAGEKQFTSDGAAQHLFGPVGPADQPLVITEGETDAMSVYEATGMVGRSIPNGTSDREESQQGDKLRFLDREYDLIKNSARVILVMDADKSGGLMEAELARRVGRAKVWRTRLPEGRKDINDVLVQDGKEAAAAVIMAAEPWPIEGITNANDVADKLFNLHEHGMPPGHGTGWWGVDKLVTIQTSMLYIITGIPGHGKSTWMDNLIVNLSEKCGWGFAIGSFETPTELGLSRLISVRQGARFADISKEAVKEHLAWANEHFHFLTSEGLVTVDSIIERTEAAVTRYGVKGLIIDPYNYVRTPGREMDTEGVNELLSKLKAFAVSADIAIFLVAHPAKPSNNSEEWIPTGYDISGSANFFNRADFGITISRARGSAEMEGDAIVTVWKAKWRHLGQVGKRMLDFDKLTERFTERSTPLAPGDDPFSW